MDKLNVRVSGAVAAAALLAACGSIPSNTCDDGVQVNFIDLCSGDSSVGCFSKIRFLNHTNEVIEIPIVDFGSNGNAISPSNYIYEGRIPGGDWKGIVTDLSDDARSSKSVAIGVNELHEILIYRPSGMNSNSPMGTEFRVLLKDKNSQTYTSSPFQLK